ncbi:hypothetical protein FA13DRAFT_1644436 [Coprinellus micaceus]|uniref:Uncharacterized protein n=1 Tax=Coprinellus micaceus TaxID=71717 RepID=A0A4Y7SG94_COPMI|nr:hypothetical protein FA13DRAFT_1644436 [Coprinellus micaceus]
MGGNNLGGAGDGGNGAGAPGPANVIGGPPLEAQVFPDAAWQRQVVPGYESEEEEEGWFLGDEEERVNEPDLVEPPAYARGKPSHVRMAYLQAALNNVTGNVPVRLTNQNLDSQLNMLAAAGALPDYPPPAWTLETVKRRVGIDPKAWVIKYAACPKCWKLYAPEALETMEGPACTAEDCDGVIYELKAPKKKKRRLFLMIPQVSLIDSIRRMVRRKGYRKKFRDSRNRPTRQNNDPNFVMKDIYDGEMWDSLKTGINWERGDRDSVRDVGRGGGEGENLSSHRYGLHMTVNLDWFGCLENRPHSTGPIYVSFNDLPREERFLQTNVICVAITPGPSEPTSKQLNNVMEPMMCDAAQLKNGVPMKVWNEDETELVDEKVYGDFICNNCDVPGARKISGFAGHSALVHPCPWCRCTLDEVNEPLGYQPEGLVMRHDSEALKQKYLSKSASEGRQKRILDLYGVQWSALDYLPGWRPCKQTALDFMHCIFLGVVAWLFTRVLFAAHLFPGAGGEQSAKKRFERAINSIQWPTHITHLPKNLGENQSLKKADEWCRLLTVTPVVLWLSWKDPDNTIPDTEPAVMPNEIIETEHSCKRYSLYQAILFLCAGVRLLSTKAISMAQAAAGQTYLQNYFTRMLALNVQLSINHHLAMHFAPMIKLFGPVYGWWLFAFERFNGMLKKVKHNGHDRGRIEVTLMRNWVQSHLLYELFLHLPEDATDFERNLIDQIIAREAQRGGMAVEIAIFRAEASVNNVSLPKNIGIKTLDLHRYDIPIEHEGSPPIYEMLLTFVGNLWPDRRFKRQFSLDDGIPFVGRDIVRRLSYFRKDGIRYGAHTNNTTDADTFAFIQRNNARVPVSIEDILLLKIPPVAGQEPLPAHVCLLVRRLKIATGADVQGFIFPWEVYSNMLGIHVALADHYEPYEIISALDIDCPVARIPAQLSSRENFKLSICVSFDHVRTSIRFLTIRVVMY